MATAAMQASVIHNDFRLLGRMGFIPPSEFVSSAVKSCFTMPSLAMSDGETHALFLAGPFPRLLITDTLDCLQR